MLKQKYLLVLTIISGIFIWANQADAAIWPVPLDQDNITVDLSQDLKLQITSYDYDGDRLFVNFDRDGNKIKTKIYPSNVVATFNLITNNQDLINNNPEYSFTDEVNTETINPVENLTAVVDKQFEYKLFSDDQITIGSDQKTNSLVASKNLRTYTNKQANQQVSKVYDINFNDNNSVPLKINLRYNSDSSFHKSAYYFDYQTFNWISLPSYNDLDEKSVYFELDKDKARLAIFEDNNSFDGKASWYDQSFYRNFDYKNGNYAAHRTLPKGTKILVTRLKTGKQVTVEVNDWGPKEQTGRIIDLEKQAFKAIGSLGAGEIYVNIKVIND